uniref:Thymidylate synthase n=1 Tax=Triatoma infestans TaxID=30076 RepID=A0A023F869_TRIIF
MAENHEYSENLDELKYLNFVKEILERGNEKMDRTNVGTLSLFGAQMRYSLRDNTFPVLTTKRVFLKSVIHELLWFIKGSTNAKELSDKGVRIWDKNSSRQFLDSLGLTDREEGDLGPVYGFQWRHLGAKYENMHADYSGKGIDQLTNVINLLRNNPDDRRIIMTAWNPLDLKVMALPPCHCFVQFYCCNGELSAQMYQRSADMGLGVPFNIASYSLLTHMIAHITGYKPAEFIHTIGDAHIYKNHIDALKVQLNRKPKPFPKIFFKRAIDNIDDFTFDDIIVQGYDPYAKIQMEMAV